MKKVTFLLAFLLLTANTYANRILDLRLLGASRCAKRTNADCYDETNYALETGCITQVERDYAITNNFLVTCRINPATKKREPSGKCACGCFYPTSKIVVFDKSTNKELEVNAIDIFNNDVFNFLTFSEDSKIDDLVEISAPIHSRVSGKEALPIVEIHLDNGRSLKLTTKHAVVMFNGAVKKAKDIKTGDTLLGRYSDPISVTKISAINYGGNVYNFSTGNKGVKSDLIVSEGVVVGDLDYQNRLSKKKQAFELRK